MDELGEKVLAMQRSIAHSRHGLLGTPVDRAIDGLPPASAAPIDFEQFMSALAESQPYLHGPENDRRRALFGELSGLIALEVEAAVGRAMFDACPEWLCHLIALWHQRQTHVLTFNYDTLVEAAVEYSDIEVADVSAERRSLTHRDVGPSPIPWWDGGRRRAATTFSYYKLHGSIDWYWDETTRSADSIVEIGYRYGWTQPSIRYAQDETMFRAPGKVPMIVPPTWTKSTYFDNPVIRHLWHTSYLALQRARRIIVVGYSLPPGDVLVRAMLADCLVGKEVWIADPSSLAAERFSELGPESLVEVYRHGHPDAATLVERYASEG